MGYTKTSAVVAAELSQDRRERNATRRRQQENPRFVSSMRSKAVPWFQLTNYFLSANSRRWFCRQQLIWLNDGWSLGNSNNYRQIIHIISRSSNNSRSFSVTLSAPHLIAHFGILDQTNQHHLREKEEQLDFIFNLLKITTKSIQMINIFIRN